MINPNPNTDSFHQAKEFNPTLETNNPNPKYLGMIRAKILRRENFDGKFLRQSGILHYLQGHLQNCPGMNPAVKDKDNKDKVKSYD